MSFTSFSTIGSSNIGISNSSKKNIIPPISYIKYNDVYYLTAFVFGSGNFVWNSILPEQRYTNSRTVGSLARLTGTNEWLNGTYTWSSNATTVINNLAYLTEGDPSISWIYSYPSSDPINITISLPLNIKIVLKGINIKSSSIGAGVTITVDGSNDGGITFDTNIASFVTTSALSVGEDLVCSDTLQYNIIRFNIPYLTTVTNFQFQTLNPKMDVYYYSLLGTKRSFAVTPGSTLFTVAPLFDEYSYSNNRQLAQPNQVFSIFNTLRTRTGGMTPSSGYQLNSYTINLSASLECFAGSYVNSLSGSYTGQPYFPYDADGGTRLNIGPSSTCTYSISMPFYLKPTGYTVQASIIFAEGISVTILGSNSSDISSYATIFTTTITSTQYNIAISSSSNYKFINVQFTNLNTSSTVQLLSLDLTGEIYT